MVYSSIYGCRDAGAYHNNNNNNNNNVYKKKKSILSKYIIYINTNIILATRCLDQYQSFLKNPSFNQNVLS